MFFGRLKKHNKNIILHNYFHVFVCFPKYVNLTLCSDKIFILSHEIMIECCITRKARQRRKVTDATTLAKEKRTTKLFT